MRARDGVGNSEGNLVRLSADPFSIEAQLLEESFDSGAAGWSLDPASNALPESVGKSGQVIYPHDLEAAR